MNHNLNIPAQGALFFHSLRATVHRLDFGIITYHKVSYSDNHVSDNEFNVNYHGCNSF